MTGANSTVECLSDKFTCKFARIRWLGPSVKGFYQNITSSARWVFVRNSDDFTRIATILSWIDKIWRLLDAKRQNAKKSDDS
jgi:hypothetical protein